MRVLRCSDQDAGDQESREHKEEIDTAPKILVAHCHEVLKRRAGGSHIEIQSVIEEDHQNSNASHQIERGESLIIERRFHR